jgi:hypothetical protein
LPTVLVAEVRSAVVAFAELAVETAFNCSATERLRNCLSVAVMSRRLVGPVSFPTCGVTVKV